MSNLRRVADGQHARQLPQLRSGRDARARSTAGTVLEGLGCALHLGVMAAAVAVGRACATELVAPRWVR